MHRAKITTEDKVESDSDGERAFSAYEEVSDDQWLMDSGASTHMTPRENISQSIDHSLLLRKLAWVMVGLLRQWELELSD